METDGETTGRLAELRVSARGWHGVQLAVLGFIGFCGVLESGGSDDNPHWLRVLAGLLVLAAFGLACTGTVFVALAAWPTYGPGSNTEGQSREVARTSARLRVGIVLTFVAVAVLAIATSSAWWPSGGSGGTDTSVVRVSTPAGEICGDLQESSRSGVLAVTVDGQVAEVSLSNVSAITPVNGC
jgi:hypothetical protein